MIVTDMCPDHMADVKRLLDICFCASSWSEKMIRDQMDKSGSRCTVAVEDDAVVGFLAFEQVADEGSVIEIAVHPDFRRQGIARRLITDALNTAKDLYAVFLEVRESNAPAIALYTALGFERIGVRKDYYDYPKENGVIYRLPLPKGG